VRWLGDVEAARDFLAERPWGSVWGVVKLANAVLRSLGVVAFANSPLTGALIFTGMLVGNPAVAAAALAAGVLATLVMKLLGAPEALVCDGVTAFNTLLVGCISTVVAPALLGTALDAWHWALLGAAFVVTCYIDLGLCHLMAPCGLPVQSIPFNVATALFFLAARGLVVGHHAAAVVAPLHLENVTAADYDWGQMFQGTVLAAGQIYGVGTMAPSVLIWLGFLAFSPLLSLFFFIGSLVGTLCASSLVPHLLPEVAVGLWGYNSLLAAGGASFFLEPSVGMFVTAVVAAVLAVVSQAAIMPVFLPTQVPVLSFPFNIAITLVLAVSLLDGTPLVFMPERSFHERHVYETLVLKERRVAPGRRDVEKCYGADEER